MNKRSQKMRAASRAEGRPHGFAHIRIPFPLAALGGWRRAKLAPAALFGFFAHCGPIIDNVWHLTFTSARVSLSLLVAPALASPHPDSCRHVTRASCHHCEPLCPLESPFARKPYVTQQAAAPSANLGSLSARAAHQILSSCPPHAIHRIESHVRLSASRGLSSSRECIPHPGREWIDLAAHLAAHEADPREGGPTRRRTHEKADPRDCGTHEVEENCSRARAMKAST